jgi:hypothetical protein
MLTGVAYLCRPIFRRVVLGQDQEPHRHNARSMSDVRVARYRTMLPAHWSLPEWQISEPARSR